MEIDIAIQEIKIFRKAKVVEMKLLKFNSQWYIYNGLAILNLQTLWTLHRNAKEKLVETGVADMEYASRWKLRCIVKIPLIRHHQDAKEECHSVCSFFIIKSREMLLKAFAVTIVFWYKRQDSFTPQNPIFPSRLWIPAIEAMDV